MKQQVLDFLSMTYKRDKFSLSEIAEAFDIIEEVSIPEYIETYPKLALYHGFKYVGLDFIGIREKKRLTSVETMNRNIVMHIAVFCFGCNKREVLNAVNRHRATAGKYFDYIDEIIDGNVKDKAILMTYNRCAEHMGSKLKK